MEFNDYLKKCQDDDVLCYRQEELFKIGKFKEAIITAFNGAISQKLKEEFDKKQINIRILREGRNGRFYEDNVAWFRGCLKSLNNCDREQQKEKLSLN